MSLVDRARAIILRPAQEWPVIAAEPATVAGLYTGYIIPLAAIGPIAGFIGLTTVGQTLPFIGTIRFSIATALEISIATFLSTLITVYLLALIINALAPTFLSAPDMIAALKLAAYAYTPALVASVLNILPALGLLVLFAAIYGFYLLKVGLPVLMKTPPPKTGPYVLTSIVCAIVVSIVLSAVVGQVRNATRYSALGEPDSEAMGRQIAANMIGAAAGGGAANAQHAADIVNSVAAAAKDAEKAGASASAPAADSSAADREAAKSAAAGMAMIGALVSGGKKPVDVVDFHALKAMLPGTAGGLPQTHAEGEKSTVTGFTTSKATGTYADGQGKTLVVDISDLGNAHGLMALGAIAMSATEKESDTGYDKNVVVGDRKIHEQWTTSGKESSLTEMVGDRYLIEAKGSGVEMDAALDALKSIDVSKLPAAPST